MTYKRLSKDEIETLQRLHVEGQSFRQIATTMHLNPTTVSRWTRRMRAVDQDAPTAIDLLEAAYPWSVWLPIAGREEFARQLRNMPHWSKEADIDRLVWRWQGKANDLRRAS